MLLRNCLPTCLQHFTAPIRAGPTEFKAAFSFVYEPQLSAEQASGKAATPAAAAAKAVLATERKQESANPAKVLDGLLVGLLGGLSSSSKKEVPAPPPRSASSKTFQYPEEDIAALNAAKRFLVSAGVVNK